QVACGPPGCSLYFPVGDTSPGSHLRLTHNTFVGGEVVYGAGPSDVVADQLRDPAGKPIAAAVVEAADNICQVSRVMGLASVTAKAPNGLSIDEQLRFIPKLVRWRERHNVYTLTDHLFLSFHPVPEGRLKELTEWNKFWGLKDTDSVLGTVRMR